MAVDFRLVPGRGLLLLILLFVVTPCCVIAQQSQSNPPTPTATPAAENPEFKIVKRVDEVNLRFTVTEPRKPRGEHRQGRLGGVQAGQVIGVRPG